MKLIGSFNILKLKASPFLFLLAVLVSLSPLFISFVSIPGNVFFILALSSILILNHDFHFDNKVMILVLLIVFSSILLGLVWQNAKLITISIYCTLSLIVAKVICERYLPDTVDLLTSSFFFISLLSWGGFIYALGGGKSILEVINPDGRHGFLYLTTMTNYKVGNLIRPAGFFDEPGALSFFICVTAYLRDVLSKNQKITYILLFLGTVTFSLAHFIFIFLFFLFSKRMLLKNKLYVLFTAILIVFFALPYLYKTEAFDTFVISRIEVNQDGSISGDNRSERVTNALNLIDTYPRTVLFGLDEKCISGDSLCSSLYPPYGENFLFPLVHYGVLNSFFYYFIIGGLLITAIYRRDGEVNLINLAVVALLLQRPYAYSYGYSLVIAVCFLVGVWGYGKKRYK
ncbi:hypothetical protein V0242_07825 [Aeromonas hydrophila]|uniref:hypothetical protein n=1 Tax=Aeromonas hydrophila TaxID=644 RepID=UPI002ED1B8EA|nr:hypothetical protein V0242_07825 [Aeromonas hydrophila]